MVKLKKKCGTLESFSRPRYYVSNSMGDDNEINEHCNQIGKKEVIIDLDYQQYLNNPEAQFGYGNDHDYGMFLENLKEDGDGKYTVEIPMSSDISLILSYEGKEENVVRKRNFKSDSKSVKAKVPEILSGFSGKAKTGISKTVMKSSEIGNEGSKNNVRGVASEERNRPVDENLIEVEEEAEIDSIPCKPSGEPSNKMNCVIIDESCAQFLDSPDKPGNSMELSHEHDHASIHQKDDGSCSDLEIITLDNIPCNEGDYTPFVPSKCFQSLPGEEGWDGIRTSNQSQFREKVMDLLKIPYDRQEFEKLWQEVTHRKPVQGVKELRHGRMKQYPTKTNGKSYLDWYQELRMKVDEFRHDRCKILYLLRGFFFWLENTAHEGAFQPWLDSLYLNALG
ncbi:hypothetical protein REPUB_Repub19eG0106600 [Reevesia pubescens]